MLTIAFCCGVQQIREVIKCLIISSLSYLDKHVPNDTVGPCIETQDFSHFIPVCSVLVCCLLKLSFGILKPLPSFLMSKHYVEINSQVTPNLLGSPNLLSKRSLYFSNQLQCCLHVSYRQTK